MRQGGTGKERQDANKPMLHSGIFDEGEAKRPTTMLTPFFTGILHSK
jgi:hypothetical protein